MSRLLLMVLIGVMLGLAGCTTISSVSNLTGGSVPIGDVDGTLYTRSGQPLAYTAVKLTGGTQASDSQQAVTDARGNFAFTNVSQGSFTVSAQDQLAQLFAEISDRFEQGEHIHLLLHLAPPVTGNYQYIAIAPRMIASIPIGQSVAFRVVDGAGSTITEIPFSWGVKGEIGTIDINGVFRATNGGDGTILAQYHYNNVNLAAGQGISVQKASP